jgi:hypothetical protein
MTTHQELQKAIDAAGGAAECPSCGENAWIGMGVDGNADKLFMLNFPSGEGPQEVGLYSSYGMYCGRCGFVRLHNPNPLGLD